LGKYEPLRGYLAGLAGDEEPMTFTQLEQLVGPLPDSAREHRAWWGNDDYKSQSQAWRAAGWHVASVNQSSGEVVFARGVHGGTSKPRQGTHAAWSYIDAQVIAAIKAQEGTDRFDRSKLLRLIQEPNDNYLREVATPRTPCSGPSWIMSRRCWGVPTDVRLDAALPPPAPSPSPSPSPWASG
jgi:hypothetical protein